MDFNNCKELYFVTHPVLCYIWRAAESLWPTVSLEIVSPYFIHCCSFKTLVTGLYAACELAVFCGVLLGVYSLVQCRETFCCRRAIWQSPNPLWSTHQCLKCYFFREILFYTMRLKDWITVHYNFTFRHFFKYWKDISEKLPLFFVRYFLRTTLSFVRTYLELKGKGHGGLTIQYFCHCFHHKVSNIKCSHAICTSSITT